MLTFQEIQDVFDYAGINLAEMEEDDRDHSSRAGRIYAGTGGVSEAVRSTVSRINPGKPITVKTRHADGVPACKQMLNDILEGNGGANFFEGMGCVGGCVGGPKAPVYFFDDSAIVLSESQSYKPFSGLADTYNGVQASYPEPKQLWQIGRAHV